MARVDSFLDRIGVDVNANPITIGSQPIYPMVPADATVNANITSRAIVAADFGKNITNTGALGAIVFTLPAASSALKGKVIRFQSTAAQQVSISPVAADAVYLGGSGVDNKDVVIPGVIGNHVDVFCDGTNYLVTGYNGAVTKEA